MPLTLVPNCIIVDVSHWQEPGTIDWKAAHELGNVHGVIVKLMQNGEPDPAAAQHLANAYAAGVEHLGVYDFESTTDDAMAFYNQVMAEFNKSSQGVLVALDAEKSADQPTVVDAVDWQDNIFANMRRYPTLYMGKDGPDGTGAGLTSTQLARSDLWLPKYGPEPTAESLPPGFHLPTSDTDRGGVMRLWQFTGDGIDAPASWPQGVPKGCDLSYALFTSLDALSAWWGA